MSTSSLVKLVEMAAGKLHSIGKSLCRFRMLTNVQSMVEFETHDDLREAVLKLDGTEFKGNRVTCMADVSVRISFNCMYPHSNNSLTDYLGLYTTTNQWSSRGRWWRPLPLKITTLPQPLFTCASTWWWLFTAQAPRLLPAPGLS